MQVKTALLALSEYIKMITRSCVCSITISFNNNLFISVDLKLASLHCVFSENNHTSTYPNWNYWKFQEESWGGGGEEFSRLIFSGDEEGGWEGGD